MRGYRSMNAFAVILFLLLFLSDSALAQRSVGSQQKWQQAVSGAEKEGRVVVFGPPGDIVRTAITQGFRKAFPKVTIEYTGGRGGELATRLKAEMDAGLHNVDVFLTGTSQRSCTSPSKPWA